MAIRFVLSCLCSFLLSASCFATADLPRESSQPLPIVAPAEQGAECGICLEAMSPGQVQSRACTEGHVFHQDCLSPWLREHDTCPTCRAHYPPLEEAREDVAVPRDWTVVVIYWRSCGLQAWADNLARLIALEDEWRVGEYFAACCRQLALHARRCQQAHTTSRARRGRRLAIVH
ncbi:hypothetical protein EBZ39_09470 [bacterium]|nr:hypothetical protein [bacterium]